MLEGRALGTKGEIVRIRVSGEEKEAWAAKVGEGTVSGWLRGLANAALVEEGVVGSVDTADAPGDTKPSSASAGDAARPGGTPEGKEIEALPARGVPAALELEPDLVATESVATEVVSTNGDEPELLGPLVEGCRDHRGAPKAWCLGCQRERGKA